MIVQASLAPGSLRHLLWQSAAGRSHPLPAGRWGGCWICSGRWWETAGWPFGTGSAGPEDVRTGCGSGELPFAGDRLRLMSGSSSPESSSGSLSTRCPSGIAAINCSRLLLSASRERGLPSLLNAKRAALPSCLKTFFSEPQLTFQRFTFPSSTKDSCQWCFYLLDCGPQTSSCCECRCDLLQLLQALLLSLSLLYLLSVWLQLSGLELLDVLLSLLSKLPVPGNKWPSCLQDGPTLFSCFRCKPSDGLVTKHDEALNIQRCCSWLFPHEAVELSEITFRNHVHFWQTGCFMVICSSGGIARLDIGE